MPCCTGVRGRRPRSPRPRWRASPARRGPASRAGSRTELSRRPRAQARARETRATRPGRRWWACGTVAPAPARSPPAAPRDESDAEDRVDADLEEVVLDADAIAVQQLGGNPREGCLGLVARGHDDGGLVPIGRRRECRTIDLAVGGNRHRRDRDVPRRDHGLGKPALQPLTQLGRLEYRRPGRHIVRGQSRRSPRILAGDYQCLANLGMSRQCGLDLGRLDPDPADLDLAVGAAQELDQPLAAPPRPVAGGVHPRREIRKDRGGTAPPSAPDRRRSPARRSSPR